MRENFDYSHPIPNPYAAIIGQEVTLKLSRNVVQYFKQIGDEIGLPHENIMELFLRECTAQERKLVIDWGTDDDPENDSESESAESAPSAAENPKTDFC